MTWFRSLCIAVSMYSRLPVPYGNWDKKEMKYSIGLFPIVGAVIGVMTWLWLWGMRRIAAAGTTELPDVVFLAVSTLIAAILPVLVTGGIHVDGFMDTCDAFHSWADRDKKLQILSDPHIGAFSVISLLILAAVWVSAVAVVAGSGDSRSFGVFALAYVLARALSGLAAVLFKNARGEGTLWAFTDFGEDAKRINLVLLCAEGLAAAIGMILLKPVGGGAAVIMSAAIWVQYKRKAYKELGGITGDLEGWFLCRCEAAAACALAVVCICGI